MPCLLDGVSPRYAFRVVVGLKSYHNTARPSSVAPRDEFGRGVHATWKLADHRVASRSPYHVW